MPCHPAYQVVATTSAPLLPDPVLPTVVPVGAGAELVAEADLCGFSEHMGAAHTAENGSATRSERGRIIVV